MTPPGTTGVATAELTVHGMHCESCASLIEEVLSDQHGVRAATVDLGDGRAHVEYDPSLVSLEDLTGAVADAGYTAAPHGARP